GAAGPRGGGGGGPGGCAARGGRSGGRGAPADALPRFFEPFFSLKTTGTGLGLAIARRTIAAHGGRIEAHSVPGAGMTMHITLPLARPAGSGVTSMVSGLASR